MMALFWYGVVFSVLVAAFPANAEMTLDCWPDYVKVVWTENRNNMDMSLFRLGDCLPSSLSARQAVFNVAFEDCKFQTLVTGNKLVYNNELIFLSSPDSTMPPFKESITCSYDRPKDWYPLIYDPVVNTYGQGQMVFHIGLMNADFSGPAESTTFPLGSVIPIMASVEQKSHQPLLLLLEECVAATTSQLHSGSDLYPIVTNMGCLLDSKTSRSRFGPRSKTSEIHLSLQAFRFAVGKEVYMHCKLVAWDPVGLDETKKACNYVKNHGWELVDDPSYNVLCNCCDTMCKSRRTRRSTSGKSGVAQNAVLGPFTITDYS